MEGRYVVALDPKPGGNYPHLLANGAESTEVFIEYVALLILKLLLIVWMKVYGFCL